ncbi:hypothetical protein BU24DRAFT_425821 [Aaosphaeria arxii CBS 175.79]|uniref:RNA polymerase II transcription factor SIII subunit A n=1 Tax=Aaosphaeria arxii CBS 175.79 TaxID=1450172 RepID=A0A6A5XGL6_9PLEO|nr:uncharacterized protein BU24DRAFT_425821 [Aaosphaeria arxii CBS 175.79]KAF2011999.1 hypothetical protein BU24DRAFT_425821 [Aaosphaeria arxii CBS 175.79]
MPVPSLYELAKTRLIQNVHLLTDISDLPYDFLAPILRNIQNPSQLLELEANSPQIVGETGEIWLRFIKRDIPNWDKKTITPRDPRNWSKAYRKLKREAEREREEDEEKLKQQMRALQQNRQGNQTKIIESRVPLDPSARSRGFAFGSRGGGGGGGWGSGSGWGSGAPTKTGKVAFDKLRRGIFDQKRAAPKAAMMPAHVLAQRRGTVAQAPARMLRLAENQQGAPSSSRPQQQRPQESSNAGADRPQRPTLQGRSFNAPKPHAQPPPVQPQGKRKREEPNMFMQRKKR